MSLIDDIGEGAKDIDMSYGDSSAYPALGFNPAPGNGGTIGTLASNFLTVSGHLGQAHEAMTKAGQAGGFWQGQTAENFHNKIGELPDYLDKANRSLGEAGQALDGWHTDLASLQRTAAEYEQQAAQLAQKSRPGPKQPRSQAGQPTVR